MVQFVIVNVDTSALFSPATRAYGNVGIVGYGLSGSVTDALVFEKQTDVETEYGAASAIAQAANLAFQNGAKTIFCARATHTSATQQLDTGDGIKTEFQLTLTEGFPQQGSMVVTVNSIEVIEGTDYYVDYGNGKVIFFTAPGDTLAITFDFDFISAANFIIALVLLDTVTANIVVGAMIYEGPLLEDLKDHVNSLSSSGKERIGVAMLPNGNSDGLVNAVQVVGTTGVITGEERMCCFGSVSVDDVAAACAGIIASFEPWISMILKPLSGVVKQREMTTTEESALLALQVNPVIDPDVIVGSGLYTAEGYNLASDASMRYIDIVRVIDDISYKIKAGLTNPNTIGNLKINATGLRTLRSQVRGILSGPLKAGEIDSYQVEVPLLPLASVPANERTAEQSAELNAAKATRQVSVDVSIEYSGAIHAITVNLKFV